MVQVDHIRTRLLEEVEDHQVGWVALFLWVLLPILFLNPPVPIPMEYQGDIDLFLLLQNNFNKTNSFPVALLRAQASLVQVHGRTVLGRPVPTPTPEVNRVLQAHQQALEVPAHRITVMEDQALLNRAHRQATEVPVHPITVMVDQVQPTRALGANEAHQDTGALEGPHPLTCLLRRLHHIQVLTSSTLQT